MGAGQETTRQNNEGSYRKYKKYARRLKKHRGIPVKPNISLLKEQQSDFLTESGARASIAVDYLDNKVKAIEALLETQKAFLKLYSAINERTAIKIWIMEIEKKRKQLESEEEEMISILLMYDA